MGTLWLALIIIVILLIAAYWYNPAWFTQFWSSKDSFVAQYGVTRT